MHELNAGPVKVGRGDYRYEGGFAAALDLFAAGPAEPEALFCANDLLAIGAIDALKKSAWHARSRGCAGRRVRRYPGRRLGIYDLTTFVQDGARMVDEALSILAVAAAGNGSGTDEVVIAARLIERGTTDVQAGKAI